MPEWDNEIFWIGLIIGISVGGGVVGTICAFVLRRVHQEIIRTSRERKVGNK